MALKIVHLNKNKGPTEEKAIRQLIRSWKGEEGYARRQKLANQLGVTLNECDYDYNWEHWEHFTYKELREIVLGERGSNGQQLKSVAADGKQGESGGLHAEEKEDESDRQPAIDVWLACTTGLLDAVEYYFTKDRPVPPNIHRGPKRDSLLMWTAMKNVNPGPTISMLLKHGADPNYRNLDGDTPLHVVCQWCPLPYEPAKILLDNGAAINAENRNKKTPLHYLG